MNNALVLATGEGIPPIPDNPVALYLQHIGTVAPLTAELAIAEQEGDEGSYRLRLAKMAIQRLDKEIDVLGQDEEVISFVTGALQTAIAVDSSIHRFGHLMPAEERDPAHSEAILTVLFAQAFSVRHGVDLLERVGTGNAGGQSGEDGESVTFQSLLDAHQGMALPGAGEPATAELPRGLELPELPEGLPDRVMEMLQELEVCYTVSKNGDDSLPSLLPRNADALSNHIKWIVDEMNRAVGAKLYKNMAVKLNFQDVIRLAIRRGHRHFYEAEKNQGLIDRTVDAMIGRIKMQRPMNRR